MSGSEEGYLVPPAWIQANQAAWIAQQLHRTLPRHVRLRLAVTRRIDGTAIWLVEHDHFEAAIRVWRVFGLWATHNPPPGQEIAPPE